MFVCSMCVCVYVTVYMCCIFVRVCGLRMHSVYIYIYTHTQLDTKKVRPRAYVLQGDDLVWFHLDTHTFVNSR
jgi:hypothetical protein